MTTTTVSVTHPFQASPERVYDAFLTPETAGKFLFATPTGQMVKVEIEPRVGGSFVFVDRRDGEDVEHRGEYLELHRPTRIVFAFAVLKYSPAKTTVTVDIVPSGTGCVVTLIQEGVPPDHAKRSEGGWTQILQVLEDVLG